MFSCCSLIRIADTRCLKSLYRSFTLPSEQLPIFKPKTALILAKLSKYDCEKSTEINSNDDQLRTHIERKGYNANLLIARHEAHYVKLFELKNALRDHGLEVHVVDRYNYSLDSVKWADVIFTAGGDGTFLLGASKILHPNKPLIGFNTDPLFSHGFLCLPKWCSSNVSTTIDLLLSRHFQWLWRQRIRVTVTHSKGTQLIMQPLDKNKPISQNIYETELLNSSLDDSTSCQLFPSSFCANEMTTTLLPVFALNEVFVGAALSASVSIYDISVDAGKSTERQKSSGVVISTGTGSTSWSHQINKLSKPNIQKLLEIIQQINPINSNSILKHCTNSNVTELSCLIETIESLYNKSFIFSPEDCKMMYTVRDPLNNGLFKVTHPHGFATELYVRSLMDEGHLVFDSGITFPFTSGSIAKFTIIPSDSLCCVQLDIPC
ncbi:NAD kinase 2, mitochondrial [Schistosoma japonicum]|nr:NAD kinase 2, mitochondrial [Schistosoma japonicum]